MASRVIKAGQMQGVRPAEFNINDTLAETQSRIESARKEVLEFQEAARIQAKQVLDEAQKQGFQAGYQQGLEQGKAETLAKHKQTITQEVQQRAATLLPVLQQTVERLREARDLWLGEWERLGIELSCAIAARIVHQSLGESSEIARQTLKQCLSLVGRCPQVTIYLNPKDAESMQLNQQGFDSIFHAIGEIRVVEDPDLTPGGCRVESEFGSIDASVETQLDRIAEELMGGSKT